MSETRGWHGRLYWAMAIIALTGRSSSAARPGDGKGSITYVPDREDFQRFEPTVIDFDAPGPIRTEESRSR